MPGLLARIGNYWLAPVTWQDSSEPRQNIPMAWIAYPTVGLDVSMTKLPITIFSKPGLWSTMTIGQAPWSPSQNKKQIYASWEAVYWNLAEANVVVSGPALSSSGGQEMICMQSSYPAQPSRISASCLILQGRWTGDFWGDKRDLDTFLAIMREIR
jgi:hypothetical protein